MKPDPEDVALFLEEAHELLRDFEQCLLVLESMPEDRELLNRAFRCAHTIKGNSAMLGFETIMGFTHELEFLLDRLRTGALTATQGVVETLLAAGDVLRALLEEAGGGAGSDPVRRGAVLALIRGRLTAQEIPKAAGLPRFTDSERALAVPESIPRAAEGPREGPREGPPVTAPAVVEAPRPTVAPGMTMAPRAGNTLFPGARDAAGGAAEAATIRVPIEKIDRLVNLVGELVIAQAMLAQQAGRTNAPDESGLTETVAQMDRYCHELQERVLGIRMLPLKSVFQRFHRVVRDMSLATGKSVELDISGEDTELDKTVIEKISDPLTHLVRNAVDHGIETPADRRAAGKPEVARVTLAAYQKGGAIFIEVRDDGRGLDAARILTKARALGLVGADPMITDQEAYGLIFLPGFSTADRVTEISGRGVGMDVVKRNVESLKGTISIQSTRGQGTCFCVKLPLTMAILDGLAIGVGDRGFVVPLVSVVELLRPSPSALTCVPGSLPLLEVRGEYLPFLRLGDLFGISPCETDLRRGTVVVVDDGTRRFALLADDVLGQFQAVLKSLETHYRAVPGVSAATILGDGRVALVLDAAALAPLAAARPANHFMASASGPGPDATDDFYVEYAHA